MKKVLKIFSLLIISIFAIINVKAGSCSGITVKSANLPWQDNAVSFNFKQSGWHAYDYKVNISSNNGTVKAETLSATCHNPGVSAWSERNQELKCERVVFDPTDPPGSLQKVHDAGIINILKKNYTYKWLAINIYELLFYSLVYVRYVEVDQPTAQLYYLENYVNYALDNNSDLKNKINTLKELTGDTSIGTKYTGVDGEEYKYTKMLDEDIFNGKNKGTAEEKKGAIDYVIAALDAAIKYKQSGGTYVTISDPTQKRENTSSEYKTTFEYKIKINNFSENGVINLDYMCLEGCNNFSKVKFYLNNNEPLTLAQLKAKNLVTEYGQLKSGKYFRDELIFKVEFTSPVKEECDSSKYKIILKYRDNDLGTSAFEISSGGRIGVSQRLYVLANYNTSSFNISEYPKEFKMCTSLNSDGSTCKSYITDVTCKQCDTNNNVVEIKEGYDVDDSCDKPDEERDLNIKKCVTNNSATDNAGHTRKDENLTSEAGDNNFVSGGGIYCKEDYKVTLPGSINVDSGRYFRLRASLEGTKQCYTSEIKSNAAAKTDVETQAALTRNAYKDYRMYKKMAECIADRTCIKDPGYSVKACDPEIIPASPNQCYIEPAFCVCDETEVTIEGEFDEEGNPKKKTERSNCRYEIPQRQVAPVFTVEFEYDSGASTCNTFSEQFSHVYSGFDFGFFTKCKASYVNGRALSNEELAGALLDQAINEIGEKAKVTDCHMEGDITKGDARYYCNSTNGFGLEAKLGTGGMYGALLLYNKVIGSYSGGNFPGTINPSPFGTWEMDYNFDPEMHFWYQEDYYSNNVINNKLDKFNETLSDVETYYCTRTGCPAGRSCVSDDYEECYGEGGWKTTLSRGTDVTIGSACACTEDGCSNYSYALSNVRYIKTAKKASAEFITPTQFYTIYPTGTIIAAEVGTDVKNGTPLENGLPVSLGTENGTKKYLLWFENLGEYFNSNELGRIWGDSDSVVSSTLQTNEACRNENTALVYEDYTDNMYHDEGIYRCTYNVNECNKCKEESDDYCDPDCPNDPDCPGDGCSPQKDGICSATCPDDPDCYCPDCPPDIKNSCVVLKDTEGIDHYYDPNGKEVNYGIYYSKCCPNGHCKVYCKSCLYDGAELKLDYRQVTSEDINPNDRILGNNWYSDGTINTAIELKAYVTKKEIMDNGNSIFDVDFKHPTDNEDFAMQVTMNPQTINWIKEQNKGSNYLNNTMECYDLKQNGKTYENVYCYSTFIDEMIKDGYGNIIIAGAERPSGEESRKNNSNGYFKSWLTDNINQSGWEVRTTEEISYYTSNFGMVYDSTSNRDIDYKVGPSWK